ncbi:MAG: hypothetical protein ACKPCM_10530, partial [Pseudanabaena sp.]
APEVNDAIIDAAFEEEKRDDEEERRDETIDQPDAPDPVFRETAQSEFNEPEPFLDVNEDTPQPESIDPSDNDELETDQLSESAEEESFDANTGNLFADITEELVVDNHEEITDASDTQLEGVESDIDAINLFTEAPNTNTSEISSIKEISEKSDYPIIENNLDVATDSVFIDSSVENTENFFEREDFTPEISDNIARENLIEKNLEIHTNLLANPVNLDPDAIAKSDDVLIDETIDDVIAETETNNSIETDLTKEAKSQKPKKSLDLFRKSRKKGFSQKIYGFGKSVKTIITNEVDADQGEAILEDDDELEVSEVVANTSLDFGEKLVD